MRFDRHIVSVIIPTLGRSSIVYTREALEKQTRPANEVIVVVDEDRRGVGWARNEGIRRAKGDLIAITDDDCVPPPDWLERLIHAVDKYNAGVAGGSFHEPDPLLASIRRRRATSAIEQIDTHGLVGNGGNIAYTRACLELLMDNDGHIFNEAFKGAGAEDWELIWRLRRRGIVAVYVPNPVVHMKTVTPLGFLRIQFSRGVGIALLLKMQRTVKDQVVFQESLIWGHSGFTRIKNWVAAAFEKIIGPFGIKDFERKRHFWLFWLGEKLEGIGFLWGIISRRA